MHRDAGRQRRGAVARWWCSRACARIARRGCVAGLRSVVVLATTVVVGALPGEVYAADRVALVIGNSQYAVFKELPNTRNDASDVGAALERLGFEVTTVVDGGRVQMHDALQSFARRSVGASIAVVFYAGHGMEMDGVNYLIPIDARLERYTDVEYDTVQLDRVLRATEGAALRLVILDACRDSPLAERLRRGGGPRSVGRGSFGALDEQRLLDETLVAYAAAAGTTAADGDGRNSPYTAALLAYLEEPLEISALFRRVRRRVLEATHGQQRPHEYQSLLGDHYLGRDGTSAPQNAAVEPYRAGASAFGTVRGRRTEDLQSPLALGSRQGAPAVTVRLAVSSTANLPPATDSRLEGEVRALLFARGVDVAADPGSEAAVRIQGAVELSDAGDVSGTGFLTATAVVTMQAVDRGTGAVLAASVARSRAAGISQADARDKASIRAVEDALDDLVRVLR